MFTLSWLIYYQEFISTQWKNIKWLEFGVCTMLWCLLLTWMNWQAYPSRCSWIKDSSFTIKLKNPPEYIRLMIIPLSKKKTDKQIKQISLPWNYSMDSTVIDCLYLQLSFPITVRPFPKVNFKYLEWFWQLDES